MKKKEFDLNEENLLETFEVEELEKRYEMGWGSGSVSGSVSYSSGSGWSSNAGVTYTIGSR